MTTPVLKIGDRTVDTADVVPLLVRYQLFPQFCREFILDQAISDIPGTPEEIEQACQQFYAAHHLSEEAARQAWLTQMDMTPAQLENLATRNLRIEKFKQLTWSSKVEAHFLACKAQLDRVVYSLIRHTDPGTLQELFFRIRAGESTFADVARQYSQGPEAETGGLIGPVPITQPHPAMAKLLANSQPGQLLPPTRLGEWFVLLRLEKRIAAQLDDATRQKLLDSLFNTWLQEQVSQVRPIPVQPSPIPAPV